MQVNASPIIHSCQNVVTSLAISFDSKTPMWYFLGFLSCIIACKIFFTFYKAKNQRLLLTQHSLKKLPKKIQKLCAVHSVKPENVVIIRSKKLKALSVGLLHPQIILSTQLIQQLSNQEIEAVFLHELHHVRRNHGLLLILAEIISSTLFLIPFLQDLQNYLKTLFEVQADGFAVKRQQSTQYLKSALAQFLRPDQPIFFPAFAASPFENLETRIQLLNHKKFHTPRFSIHLSKIILSCITILTGLLVPSFSRQVVQAQVNQGYEAMPQCTLVQCVTTCFSSEIMSRSSSQKNRTPNQSMEYQSL